MNRRLVAEFSVLMLLALAAPLLAKTPPPPPPPPTLESLKTAYETNKKEIDDTFEQQKTTALAAYAKTLEDNMNSFRTKGNLEVYLQFEKALKDAKDGAPTPDANTAGMSPHLAQVVGVCQKGLAAAEAEKVKRMTTLFGRYIASLQELVKRLVQQENISEAKVAKTELDRVKTERGAMETPEKPAPAPVAPAALPAPPPVAAPPREKERSDYPSIAGNWKEENGRGMYVVSQNGQHWAARCAYSMSSGKGEPRVDVRIEVSGNVTKDLQITGDLSYIKAPASMKPYTLDGTISSDGQTMQFSANIPGERKHKALTWTKIAK